MSERTLSSCRKRRRSSSLPKSTSTYMIIFLSIAATTFWQGNPALHRIPVADAFGVRKWISGRRTRLAGPTDSSSSRETEEQQRLLADKGGLDNESWSRSANGRSSSPLQVRKRVKAVLDKARTRTGIYNASLQPQSKPSNVVAEAASLGGLDEDYVLQLQEYATSDETNGKSNRMKNGVSAIAPNTFPDEDWVVQRPSNGMENLKRKPKDFDVIRGDVPAATSEFWEPLPFELPKISKEQVRQLEAGERVQEQSRMGREGSGYVVVDVPAPPYVVWESLLDFENYPDMIPTVRDMQLYTSEQLSIGYVNEKPVLPGTGRETRRYGTPSVTRASFVLSKFRLNIAAVHKYSPHPKGDYMIFTLDKSCTNMVLKGAKGIWHTVANPDGREGWTRVYLLCEVQISRALPTFIVDYAADRAMPRATTWLRPHIEESARKLLTPLS